MRFFGGFRLEKNCEAESEVAYRIAPELFRGAEVVDVVIAVPDALKYLPSLEYVKLNQ